MDGASSSSGLGRPGTATDGLRAGRLLLTSAAKVQPRETSLSTTPEWLPIAAGIGWAPRVPLAPGRGCSGVLWEMG